MSTATRLPNTVDVDVVIVGAGISGIGAACHLKTRRPDTSFTVIEGRASIGGTWSLFGYPGLRSDSDMPTFGYSFKPWTHRKSIADGHLILNYLQQTIDDYGLADDIRLGWRVTKAVFSSAQGLWTLTAQRSDSDETMRLRTRFLFLGTGYYDYESGFTPEFAGVGDFRGQIIHPQHWPAGMDYSDKRIVVIGSGATAVTLIPAMAKTARHVTMLQRSPSYMLSIPAEDRIAHALTAVLGHDRAYPLVRSKNIAVSRTLFKACRRAPRLMRRLLRALVRRQLPSNFDVDTHFSPRYAPWDQRLCMVPNGDLFKAISDGRASVVTDGIARFTPTSILLQSGQELAADIVVTATGLTMSPFGKISIGVDEREVVWPETTIFKSMMLSGVPNFAFALGYTNISWTLKVDLVCEHFCRLLEFMDAHGFSTVTPVLDDPTLQRLPAMDLSAGYVQRGIGAFPRAGSCGPWTVEHAYERDVERLRDGPVDDPALRFGPAAAAVSVPARDMSAHA